MIVLNCLLWHCCFTSGAFLHLSTVPQSLSITMLFKKRNWQFCFTFLHSCFQLCSIPQISATSGSRCFSFLFLNASLFCPRKGRLYVLEWYTFIGTISRNFQTLSKLMLEHVSARDCCTQQVEEV